MTQRMLEQVHYPTLHLTHTRCHRCLLRAPCTWFVQAPDRPSASNDQKIPTNNQEVAQGSPSLTDAANAHDSSTAVSSRSSVADICVDVAVATAGDVAIRLVQYQDERQLSDIMSLVDRDLSEPYSIFTYRYFLHNWPGLCFVVRYNC